MAGSPPPFLLRPCSNSIAPTPNPPPPLADVTVGATAEGEKEEPASSSSYLSNGSASAADVDRKGKRPAPAHSETPGSTPNGKVSILRMRKNYKRQTDAPDDCASSSSTASPSLRRGFHLRARKRRGKAVAPRGGRGHEGDGGEIQELGLPLGMSFAAVVSQVLERKHTAEERIPTDHLSLICTSAVKEAVANVYGKRFEYFLRNFEKSFGSTLKTLRVINEGSFAKQDNLLHPLHTPNNDLSEGRSFQEEPKSSEYVEEVQGNQRLSQENSQIVLLNGQINQQLVPISRHGCGPGFNEAILTTFEKSVMEQTRSNDLKTVEIGLTLQHLQLKQSQLDLSYSSNFLERMKISMGFSKQQFKEEKLKSQMQDLRHAELLRRCIDFLVAGLFIMSLLLVYGAWVYSYKRISEATESCTPTSKEPKSWWFPKQISSFHSSWHMLRCHVVVLSRMSFGILMILAMAYTLFQRSAGSSGPVMPVTFILLILGGICGLAGKLCIDTLGGSGYWWLLHWEVLCLLHFLANAFPSLIHHHLYGPVCVHPRSNYDSLRFWVRRCVFYCLLLLILPVLAGLVPFATLHDWKEHFTDLVIHYGEDD